MRKKLESYKIIFDMMGIFFKHNYTPNLEKELFALFEANRIDCNKVFREF